jgi:hypothetical protein
MLACLLQLEATIAKFPNFLPFNFAVQQGTLRGLTKSLAIRSTGSTADAGHLRTAIGFGGSLTAGGHLQLNTRGRDAVAEVTAADPVDVEMAAAIIADENNLSKLPQRKQYIQRHKKQLDYDDGYVILQAILLPHCTRVRKWKAAGHGEWVFVPTWGSSRGGSNNINNDRISLHRYGYRCASVPASMLSPNDHFSRNGFSAEQVEEWIASGAVRTGLGGGSAQAEKPGGERGVKECTNSWCKEMITGRNLARHVKKCKERHAAGGVLASPRCSLSKNTASKLAARGALGF